jgi:hypothetical protein
MLMRLLESVHGHLGVLAGVALLHPALLLRGGRPLSRGIRWTIGLATVLTGVAFALGVTIYGHYREDVRLPLFLRNPQAGLLFETKEHLAYAVLALALGAGVCALAAPREAHGLRRTAAALYAAAAGLCMITAGLGVYVATVAAFP